MIKPKI